MQVLRSPSKLGQEIRTLFATLAMILALGLCVSAQMLKHALCCVCAHECLSMPCAAYRHGNLPVRSREALQTM